MNNQPPRALAPSQTQDDILSQIPTAPKAVSQGKELAFDQFIRSTTTPNAQKVLDAFSRTVDLAIDNAE
jgi:hypothetical protein